jgi:chaperonin cofactor prefoldin
MGLLLVTAACGPGEVVVTMEIETANPEGEGTTMRALSDIEVQLLPYDRDQVFDSLSEAFGTPEPAIPPELEAARDEVQQAQQEWDALQRRWNTLRDTLQTITSEMEQYSRGEATYVTLFREFQDFDSELGTVERQMNAAFERFDELQRGTIRASDSIRILQDSWADDAFADVGEVFLAKQRASGLDLAVDGNLRVAPGQYWVHARYELPYTELYWNVPITVERGEPVLVRLTRENALERPAL